MTDVATGSVNPQTASIELLLAGPAGEWVRQCEAAIAAEMRFEDRLIGNPAAILPGRDFGTVTHDLSDWDGISLEFRGYVGEPPTEAERVTLFAMGFTVIRIDYDDPARHTTQHAFHGDWSCLQGQEPRLGTPRAEARLAGAQYPVPAAIPRDERAICNENMTLALQATGGHIVRAARLIGVSPKTMYLRVNAGRVARPLSESKIEPPAAAREEG